MSRGASAQPLMTCEPAGRSGPLTWVALLFVLTPLLVRASFASTTLPGWDVDPLIFWPMTPAIGPGGSMLADAIVLLGIGLLFLGEARAGRRVGGWWLAGVAIGAAPAVLHGWWWQADGSWAAHGSLGNQRIGSAWTAAVLGAIAVLHAARDETVRRALVGVLAALVVLLSLRGLQQVYVEHPDTVRTFNANREKWLAAYGWAPDSPMAQAYIRRLMQPEATGWFALSNVYASFAGLGVGIAAGWLWGTFTRASPRGSPAGTDRWIAAILLAASLAATYAADSKGGYAVAAVALGLVAAGKVARKRSGLSRLGPWLGPVGIASVLAAVAARGFFGERLGELSILFRWFYMEAAARIFASDPLRGVGPDGFQLAYLTAKNPLSPEEVTSPHSVMLDWLSTLGIAGGAWCIVLLAISVRVGRALVGPASDDPAGAEGGAGRARNAIRTGMLSLALATIVCSWLETPNLTPGGAAVRGGALALGCLLLATVSRSGRGSGIDLGLAAGALAMLAHAQIELTAVNVTACGVFLLALGAAGAAADNEASAVPGQRRSVAAGLAGAAGCFIAAAGLLIAGAVPALRWESDLKQAALAVQPLAEFADRLAALNEGSPSDERDRLFGDLAEATGRPVDPTPAGIRAAFEALEARLVPEAARLLERASGRYPDEWRVAREASRLHLRLADAASRRGDPVRAAEARRAVLGAFDPAGRVPPDPEVALRNAPRLRAEALALEALYRRGHASDGLSMAAARLEQAFGLDPYNTEIALRLFKLTRELGRSDASRQWAATCLRLDSFSRLDAGIRGLSSQDLRELQDAAGPDAGK